MTAKIFKSIFLTALLVFLLSFLIAFGFSYAHYNEEAESELKIEASYLAALANENGRDLLKTLSVEGSRMTLVDGEGRVIFDTRLGENELSNAPNHLDREEIREALESGEGYAVRQSDTFSETTKYYAVRLNDGSVLRVASEHYGIASLALKFINPIFLLFLFVLLFAFLIAKKLSGDIVRPINELNLNSPEKSEVYEELKPITRRLASQNYRIARQIDELKMRENEFASITSNMREGMMVINSRTVILSSNDSAKELFGITDDKPRSVITLDSTVEFRGAVRSALAGKNGYYEFRRGEKHYSLIASPVARDGIVEGAVIVIIDDTEKEERDALRREFTSNVSHELKTPLTSISGFAELIEYGMAEGEDAKKFAANVRKEAARLITLVGDIIRLTQLDGGEIPYDGSVDLYAVAIEVAERLSAVAERSRVGISVSGEPSAVLGTRQILEEMVYNLVDNAIKYNKPSGSVNISVYSEGGAALLTVSDTGIGIPKDKQDRVFERFYRVDKSHSKEIGGTGLGLSIVKHAAAYHKAEISLESEEGEGTKITVRFPKA